MPIRLQCACGKHLSADDHLAGKRVKCPHCGQETTLPAPRGVKPAPVGPVANKAHPSPEGQVARRATVLTALCVVWSILIVVVGVLLAIDIRRTQAETDIWGPEHDLLKPIPNVAIDENGDGFVAITRSYPPHKVVQRYTGAGLQIAYAGVSEVRPYDTMGEFEMNGRKLYCTSVTGRHIKRPGDPRVPTPGTVGSHIYGKHGDVYITYDVADAYRDPVDLRGMGQRIGDYWTLSYKPIPWIFSSQLLAGGGLVVWTLMVRRRAGTRVRKS
jgi:hypothetical protein